MNSVSKSKLLKLSLFGSKCIHSMVPEGTSVCGIDQKERGVNLCHAFRWPRLILGHLAKGRFQDNVFLNQDFHDFLIHNLIYLFQAIFNVLPLRESCMRTSHYSFLIGLMLAVILFLVFINVYQDSGWRFSPPSKVLNLWFVSKEAEETCGAFLERPVCLMVFVGVFFWGP